MTRFNPLHLLAAAMLALAGCGPRDEAPPESDQSATVAAAGIDRSHAGESLPVIELGDGEGEPALLSAQAGEPLLVNLWATWCAPCVTELPTLEALAASDGAPRVIALSQDMAPRGSVDAFIEDRKLDGLEVWHDPNMEVSSSLGADILPTTILFDAEGREVWRYVGDLDWTGAEAEALLAEVSREGAK